MSELLKGETLAKAQRDPFLPKSTGVVLTGRASAGDAGPKQWAEILINEGQFPSEFAIILFGFFLFFFLASEGECLLLKTFWEEGP